MTLTRRALGGLTTTLVVAFLAISAAPAAQVARAATPPGPVNLQAPDSGTVSTAWTGTIVPSSNADNVRCFGFPTADDFTFRVLGASSAFYRGHRATMTIRIDWTPTTSAAVNRIGFSSYFDDGTGSANNKSQFKDAWLDNYPSQTFEQAVYVNPIGSPPPTSWHVSVCGIANATPQPYRGKVTFTSTPTTIFHEPLPVAGEPFFTNYEAPEHFTAPRVGQCTGGPTTCDLTGEPSVGYNPKTDKLMYQAWLTTARITFGAKAGAARWENVTFPTEGVASADAMLYTDPKTGRTFVSQLSGACSIGAYTDDDGTTWSTALKPCQTPAGADHQTIGGGPFASPAPTASYPDATYYCSQNVAYASCALSTDGGFTYGAGLPMYTSMDCFGLHGHVKVGPDGTAYVPNKACGAPECQIVTPSSSPSCHKGIVVSRDNGNSWTVHLVPDSHVKDTGNSDPSIGIGARGTLYFGYDDRDGHPRIAVSRDHGTTWAPSIDVGTRFHVANSQFAEVIAGDDDRAAYAFLGTTTEGDDQDPTFPGVWYMYVAFTYDGGKTWTTVKATPVHPVQRGCVQQGSQCGRRNMLDFNDIITDKAGRVIVAYTEGCTGPCLTDPTNTDMSRRAALLRQTCGRGLFAAKDPGFGDLCAVGAVAAGPTPAPVMSPLPNTSAQAPGALVAAGLVALVGLAALRRRRRAPLG